MYQTVIDVAYFLLHDLFQWMSYFYLLTFFLTSKYNKYIMVLIAACIGFLPPVYKIINTDNTSFFVLLILLLAVALTSFQERKIICAAAVAVQQLVICIVCIVATTIVHSILGYYPTETAVHTPITILYIIILDVVLYVAMAFAAIVWNKVLKKKNTKSLGLFLLLPLGQALFLVACIHRAKAELDVYLMTNPYLVSAVVFSAFSDILVYIALRDNSNLQDMRFRMEQLEQEMATQTKYYEKLSEQFTVIREYRHDIRNLVSTVLALQQDEKSIAAKAELISEMEKRSDNLDIPIYCHNPLINAVIWQKSHEAAEAGVSFSVDIDICENLNMDKTDCCSVFVNLLDNAIEEASRHNGFVSIRSAYKSGILFVETLNTTDKVITNSSKVQTSKSGNHGLGTDIIKKITVKYSGTYVLSADGELAKSSVSLCVI